MSKIFEDYEDSPRDYRKNDGRKKRKHWKEIRHRENREKRKDYEREEDYNEHDNFPDS